MYHSPKYPEYPSHFVNVSQNHYEMLAKKLQHHPGVFFDGVFLIVPERDVDLLCDLQKHYSAQVIASGQMKEYEFATLAQAENIDGALIALGQSVVGLAGTTAEMLNMALKDPNAAKTLWHELYLAASHQH